LIIEQEKERKWPQSGKEFNHVKDESQEKRVINSFRNAGTENETD
jgi:hypothetical protein